MKLAWLPKVLLQHDASPYLEDLDLLKAEQDLGKLILCLHPRGLEIAALLGPRLVLFRTSPEGAAAPSHFSTILHHSETVTAATWLWSASSGDSCLAVGTSEGALQLHSLEGTLLHRQELHDTSGVVALSVRWSGSGVDPGDASEDLTIGFEDAAVRIPSFEIWPLVRWHLRAQRAGDGWWPSSMGHPAPHLTPTKWDLRGKGVGARTFTECVGPVPPTLASLFITRPEQHRFLLFTAGADPPLACFHCEEASRAGLVSLVTGLASAGAAGLFGQARGLLPGGKKRIGGDNGAKTDHVQSESGDSRLKREKKSEKVATGAAYHASGVWDEKRRVACTVVSPDCRWAACCDTLGRVAVVDVASSVVLQLLKGYRDAQVAWLVLPCPAESSGRSGAGEALLVLYAPKRGVVELWRPHERKKVCSLHGAPKRGSLLQQPALPVSGGPTAASGGAGWRLHQPNACWIFDSEDLELSDLTPQLIHLATAAAAR